MLSCQDAENKFRVAPNCMKHEAPPTYGNAAVGSMYGAISKVPEHSKPLCRSYVFTGGVTKPMSRMGFEMPRSSNNSIDRG